MDPVIFSKVGKETISITWKIISLGAFKNENLWTAPSLNQVCDWGPKSAF